MTVSELYDLEVEAYKKVEKIKRERQVANEAFSEGIEKGFDVMFQAIREALKKEGADNG